MLPVTVYPYEPALRVFIRGELTCWPWVRGLFAVGIARLCTVSQVRFQVLDALLIT